MKISRLTDLNDPFEFFAAKLLKKEDRRVLKNTIAGMSELSGLLSFSKNWHNPLLWGHYADKHRGLCLGFDIPKHILTSVVYIKERIKAGDINSFDEKTMRKLMSSKYVDWKYEDEVRSFLSLDESCSELVD